MATYAVGDIQGCFGTFERLLGRIAFDATRDRLWLVGDLVNRGPRSLEMLRWAAHAPTGSVVSVLGNHDLHLIGRALGVTAARPGDTLDDILTASDRGALIDWLLQCPLVHCEANFLLVHGGLLPQWTRSDAEREARGVEAALRRDPAKTVSNWFAWRRAPLDWSPSLPEHNRICAAIDAFTTLRTCTAQGSLSRFDGSPESAPEGYSPWFRLTGRRSAGTTVVFGHWAALGLSLGDDWLGLDTGCVWGRTLTAIRLEDRLVFQEPNSDSMQSKIVAP